MSEQGSDKFYIRHRRVFAVLAPLLSLGCLFFYPTASTDVRPFIVSGGTGVGMDDGERSNDHETISLRGVGLQGRRGFDEVIDPAQAGGPSHQVKAKPIGICIPIHEQMNIALSSGSRSLLAAERTNDEPCLYQRCRHAVSRGIKPQESSPKCHLGIVVFEKEAWKVTGSATGWPSCVMSDEVSDIPQQTPSVIVSYHTSKTASCQHAMARRTADMENEVVGV
ncbi:uncharacterized protein CLUP02_06715 [Colletotrichum lupini]|uniref:Uncharacterized protein n=1 Tax=Colletotrichum lupini TaxID=145971 RepID=A0A9Q8SPM2_9PEZI|nr:uncharacterized protein CLUP02_06715 [Colletotrichum lupini]UQC81229.1 hypothetical protein CLUP02_06715 [Colletotrichum lupini]